MNYEPGTLVSARGREWVVLPNSGETSVLLKPLGGTDAEIAQIFPSVEKVAPARFANPDPQKTGDAESCALLRDAIRLGLRSTTGPFRSFGHIAVEPRPYQLVPLLMAMRQETVRLLIADDVGIGKTVEALLIARELLDRGEIGRLCVVCPPQLAEQWQKELAGKFDIQAELVLPSTIRRLERERPGYVGESVFEKYPFTVVSLDYIKSGKHRDEFLRACPEFVIVDEAHSCASASGGARRKQRYELIRALASDPDRHMLFVTATPHSGKDDVFRSLLAFLEPDLAALPEDLAGSANEPARRRLAQYLVQRRRGDIRAYMDAETPFPVRKTQELTWSANPEWRELFEKSLALARDGIRHGAEGNERDRRASWWSALALLRAVSSSPAAALQTLATKAGSGEAESAVTAEQLDELGAATLYDIDPSDERPITDTLPGADASSTVRQLDKSRYSALARLARNLLGKNDSKLQELLPHIRKLLADGFSPVIFCRFIPTALYLARELAQALPDCHVEAVTGMLEPELREQSIQALARHERRILVCTDCLSEGINLQENFNSAIHYDLSWNPTRHEQREGRVDRFGQPSPEARIITWWGKDNPMDGMVLDVLLRKHESIRKSLGISVPVPADVEKVMETLLNGLLMRKRQKTASLPLPGVEDFVSGQARDLAAQWDEVSKKEETRSRTLFAQQTIKTDDVARNLAEANAAQGSANTVEEFVSKAWTRLGGVMLESRSQGRKAVRFAFDPHTRSSLSGLNLPEDDQAFVFSQPAARGQTILTRTHPLVENLACWLAQSALDPLGSGELARSGVMRTSAVKTRTTLLLCRLRFLLSTSGAIERTEVVEECASLAFTGAPQDASWLAPEEIQPIFAALPTANVQGGACAWIEKVVNGLDQLAPELAGFHKSRAAALYDAHSKARNASKRKFLRYRVTPQGEPDILGIYVYLPDLSR